jgi:hypothetical protein
MFFNIQFYFFFYFLFYIFERRLFLAPHQKFHEFSMELKCGVQLATANLQFFLSLAVVRFLGKIKMLHHLEQNANQFNHILYHKCKNFYRNFFCK